MSKAVSRVGGCFLSATWNQLRKGLDPAFDFKKLSFVQEASVNQHEAHIISAQSSINNARKQSLMAAFNLFTTNLQNDWVLQDKYLASAAMTTQRARSVLVHSLEVGYAGAFSFCGSISFDPG